MLGYLLFWRRVVLYSAVAAQRDRFVSALEDVAGIVAVMLTDESALSDFMLDDKDRAALSTDLGVAVNSDDYVADVLERMP